ncbi:Glycosyl transferase family 2 [Tumidithrix helvetica PCC 7403]|uniref:glycosyltransferase family 2 protein n=1 Tax=Tumidithrix helvetica TaxID=3457545 RepID=UPI003CC38820
MISVVMPAYNASKFIDEAIKSILNQTLGDFELIIVDDGSTDNTVDIVKHYLKLDRRIRLIQNNHKGISHALNTGLKEAKYDWIARIDADDIALPERFEKQIKAANANPKVLVWGTYAYHISSTGKVLSLQQQGPISEEEFHRILNDGMIPFVIQPTVLLKKEILLKVGEYDERFTFAQDLDLLSRISDHGSILAIPEPLLLYRVHLQSVSMQKFFLQQFFARCIYARHQARRTGAQLPEPAQFEHEEKKRPILSRLPENLQTLGRFFYRKAGLFFAEKQYIQATWYLGFAMIIYPSYSIPRIWNQKLSPQTRQALKEAKFCYTSES